MSNSIPCFWCETPIYKSNTKRHLNACFYKNEIEMTKSDFQYLKNKRSLDIKFEKKEEVSMMEMKNFITELNSKASNLYSRVVLDDGKDPIEKINDMNVTSSTKKVYIREWQLFDKWLTNNQKTLSKDSANNYIATLECKDSTQKRKYQTLQVLIQHIIDPSIKLNKFRKRVEFRPKKALTNEELKDYLSEQRELDTEDYLIQVLMATYGLRINSVAGLQVVHLGFLNAKTEEGMIVHFPDSKTKKKRAEKIDDKIANQLRDFVKGKIQDDYVFYSRGKHLDIIRRSRDLSVRITNRLKSSKVLSQDPNYQLSSHVFRKSRVYTEFNEGVNLLKEKARNALGQSQGSQAIDCYVINP